MATTCGRGSWETASRARSTFERSFFHLPWQADRRGGHAPAPFRAQAARRRQPKRYAGVWVKPS